MSEQAVELNGILLEDGTVMLDRPPDLPPGPVRVILTPNEAYRQTSAWQTFERIWAEQRARGVVPRSKEEVDADLAAAREEDEERMQALERLAEEARQARNNEGPSSS